MSHQAAGVIVEEELSSKESILDMVVTQEERDAKYTQQQSLAAALLQAINTGDQSLFDICFEVQDEHLIDGTVKAMIGNNAKIQILAQQIQKRLSSTGSSIQIWLSALLRHHSAGLVTAQMECFTAIKRQLEGKWNIGRLTRLRGKIDMVLAARRAQEQKEEGMQWDDSSSSNNNNVNKNEKEEVNEESSQTDSEEQELEEEEEESSFNEDDEEEDEEDDEGEEEEIVEVVKKSSKQAKQPINSKQQQANKNKNSQTSKKAAAKISDDDIDEEDSDYLQL